MVDRDPSRSRDRPGSVEARDFVAVDTVDDGDIPSESFDGVAMPSLRAMLGVPALHLFSRAGSALDVAHGLALHGAPHGTLVLADAQTHGRGRGGKHWASPPGTGLWMTLIARPGRPDVIRILTIRLGLAAAAAVEPFAAGPVQIKWPNDLYTGGGKLAGVLVEARWRGATPEWLAIGAGVNVIAPAGAPNAAGLRAGTNRVTVLAALIPALVGAAARTGETLDDIEMLEYVQRDLAVGRSATQPARGTVLGITPSAELLMATDAGAIAIGSGSLVLSEEL